MFKDRIFPSYGILNPIEEEKTGRFLDARNTLTVDILKEVALGNFKKDAFQNTGPLKGIVLRVDNNPNNSEPNSWMHRLLGRTYSLTTVKVRIPEIHAILPEPSRYGNLLNDEANKVIDLYPSFVAINEEVSNKPVAPGDIVLVDFVNRINLEHPIYLGPVLNSPMPGAVGQKQVKSNFEKDNQLDVLPPAGDSIGGVKEQENHLPEIIKVDKKPDLENLRNSENVHLPFNSGIPPIKNIEMAYKNGTEIGLVELIELDLSLASNSGIFLLKSYYDRFVNMAKIAKKNNIILKANSGFRSLKQQEYLYDGYINGIPGFNVAAKPKFSNHQSGVAIDIADTKGGDSSVYQWLTINGPRFGFINTGKNFRKQKEFWHWEYVGG